MNLDRTISAIIVILLIIGVIGVFYIMVNYDNGEKFTEFYLLGPGGKAGDYPTNLSTGQTGYVTVGIVNHEQSTSSYQMVIIKDSEIFKVENITLKDGDKEEIPFEFTAGPPGQYKLEFNLYKLPDTQNVYRSLFLLVNVQ
jgi:uncharacterized membrane protein